MTKRRILVVFGTRPEAIKLFPVIEKLRAEPSLEVRICVTAQHREMLDQVLSLANIVPDIDLNLMRPGQSLDELTANLIKGLGNVLDSECPQRVVVQGDTTTAMVGALSAYYRKIPVAHVEAGLRSGNIHHPWPEEVNRRVVATIADLHFAPTRAAGDFLRGEKISPDTIYETGNTVVDALIHTQGRLRTTPQLAGGLDDLASRFTGKRIIVVTTHRRENFHAMQGIAETIGLIAERPDVAIIFPVHPNPNVLAVMNATLTGKSNVAIIAPQDYAHFVRLLEMADIVLTDSGGIQEEAPTFGTPVLVMRETTERPEGIAAGTAKLVGTDPQVILRETNNLLDNHEAYQAMAHAHSPYGDGQASARIAKIIADAA